MQNSSRQGLGDEVGEFTAVSDSGANISVTSVNIVVRFGFHLFLWEVPVRIRFGNSSTEVSKYYINCGPIVGRVAVIENAPETLLSLWGIAQRGFTIELNQDFIIFKITNTNQVVYSQRSDINSRQWNVDLFSLMHVDVDKQPPQCADPTAFGNSSQSLLRIAPRMSPLLVQFIRTLHKNLHHTANAKDIVDCIRHRTWLNLPDISPVDVVKALSKYPCISCALAKMNRLPTPLGSGVKPNVFGQCWSMDFILVARPAVSSQGYIGFFFYVELSSGDWYPIFTKSKASSFMLQSVELVRRKCKQYNHEMKVIRPDAASVRSTGRPGHHSPASYSKKAESES